MRIPLLAFALLLAWPPPALASWRRPVPGPVARPFAYSPADPFRAGAHRGVDLSASPGGRVRAACDGVVVTARAGGVPVSGGAAAGARRSAGSGNGAGLRAGGAAGMGGAAGTAGGTVAVGAGVVTLRCGRWRVTALPLAVVSVRVGERVRAGAAVGRLGTMAGHSGLHLGVRRAADAFAYVDPLPLLAGEPPPPAAVPREGPRTGRPRVAPPRVAPPVAAPEPRVSAPPDLGGVRVPVGGGAGGLAPWPAWVGLAALVLGAVGGGLRIRARGRLAALAEPAGERVPSAP